METPTPKYTCNWCGQPFDKSQTLAIHVRFCHPRVVYPRVPMHTTPPNSNLEAGSSSGTNFSNVSPAPNSREASQPTRGNKLIEARPNLFEPVRFPVRSRVDVHEQVKNNDDNNGPDPRL